MQNQARMRRIVTVLAVAATLWTSAPRAQLDWGLAGLLESKPVEIVQHGRRVGLAWVFPSGDRCQYTEYWYLSALYVYPNSPGEGQTIDTVIRAIGADGPAFKTPRAFFQYARAAMPAGKRILAPSYEMENCGPNHGG